MKADVDGGDPAAVARALVAARQQRRAVSCEGSEAALRNAEQAYAAQQAVADALGWFTLGLPACWKSGGASREMPLTHAPLAAVNVRASPALFDDLALNSPGIEAEIALRLARSVSPAEAAALTTRSTAHAAAPAVAHSMARTAPQVATQSVTQDLARLIDAMTVSIEVVDSRWQQGAQAPALLRLADSQSHAALALGEWVPYAARDWSAQRCELRIGSQPLVVRTGSLPLVDPAWLLPQWLRHATRHGDTVPAGTVVTTGSWVGIVPVQRGDEVLAEFPGIGTARLRL